MPDGGVEAARRAQRDISAAADGGAPPAKAGGLRRFPTPGGHAHSLRPRPLRLQIDADDVAQVAAQEPVADLVDAGVIGHVAAHRAGAVVA